nr:MAG TPA: hypothetical protein [Caudoviricetes sp.]
MEFIFFFYVLHFCKRFFIYYIRVKIILLSEQ